MNDTVTICFRIPVKVDAALRRLAKAARGSINQQVVIACADRVASTKKGAHLMTDADVDAISEAESLVRRLASSYDVYGGIDLKALLATLGKITGTYEEPYEESAPKRAKGER